MKNYPWAREAQDDRVKKADAWKVPDIARPPRNDPGDTYGPFLFTTASTESDLLSCACSWQLTGNKAHAEKVALFLRWLSDPSKGYAKTLRGCSQSLCRKAVISSTSPWPTT